MSRRRASVAVFIDWQNTYRQARRTFGLDSMGSERGNYSPLRLARTLAAGNGRGPNARLATVEIHRGIPSQTRDRQGYAANRSQADAWIREAPGIVVPRRRPLAYRAGRAVEKGIDVQLAVSIIEWTTLDLCDVAILFSHDADLVPAVEAVARIAGPGRMETASWARSRSSLRHLGVFHHALGERAFRQVETPVHYARRPRPP